jgi:1,4-dihydroxy-2-naphthoyl-CoA synthase
MSAKEFNNIIYDQDDQSGIVLVTINRPEIKNALTILVLLELHRAAELFENDDTALTMIITGAKAADNYDPAKEAFSSGGYFNPADLEALDEETKAEIDLTDIAPKKLCLK